MRSSNSDLNAYDFLQAVLHYTGTACARRVHLERVASSFMYSQSFSLEGLASSREALSLSRGADELLSTVEEVEVKLLEREIERALAFALDPANDHTIRTLSSFKASKSQLQHYLDLAIEFYKLNGIVLNRPEIFLVDELPAPFNKGASSVLTVDSEDELRFGIPSGLYFTQHAVTPIFADYTIAHELVHWCLGTATPQLVASQFEEGVADFVSMFRYTSVRYGKEVSRNTALIHRLTSAAGLSWENYVDAARATYLAVSRSGFPTLYVAINEGRASLDSFRREYLGSADASNGTLLSGPEQVLLDFPRNRVVSAVAFEVAKFVRPGITSFEIASAARIERHLAVQGLEELENEGYITTRRDGIVVEYAPVMSYLADGEFRYDFRK